MLRTQEGSSAFIFLRSDRREADWVACAIGLAHQLLDARVDDTPVAQRAERLPGWLIRDVRRNWDQPFPERYPPLSYVPEMSSYLRHPRGLLKALRTRWPDPIEATIRLKGPFNEMPRLLFQMGYAFLRIVKISDTHSVNLGAQASLPAGVAGASSPGSSSPAIQLRAEMQYPTVRLTKQAEGFVVRILNLLRSEKTLKRVMISGRSRVSLCQ